MNLVRIVVMVCVLIANAQHAQSDIDNELVASIVYEDDGSVRLPNGNFNNLQAVNALITNNLQVNGVFTATTVIGGSG